LDAIYAMPWTKTIFSLCLLMPSMLLPWLASALDSIIKAVDLSLATISLVSASALMIAASLSAKRCSD